MNLVAWICTALALLGIGAGGGVAWQARHQSADMATARAELQTCNGTAAEQAIAIGNFQQRAAEDAEHLRKAREVANKALDQRDVLAQTLDSQTKAREAAANKVTHETSDCQPLAAMPVCAALADRLWGSARAAAPGSNPAH